MNMIPKNLADDFPHESVILIVDDNPANLSMIVESLGKYGFEVLIARSGESGLERAQFVRPDLILLDILMPGMDGFETCRLLKSNAITKDIPVIFMTALAETEHKIKGFEAGAVDYITKPLREEETLARVATHLRLRELTESREQKVLQRTSELAAAVTESKQLNQQLQQEIAERARAQEALQESEEKYRLLVENANEGIFVGQDGVFKFPNRKTLELTGYSAEELLRMPFGDFIHPDDRETVIERHRRRLGGEKPVSTYSFRIIHKSGLERTVQINSVLILWEDRPATLSFLRDITQLVELEASLQQAQKMESIGTLAGGIAHNFNNVLMAIQGRTSLMLMDKDPAHPDFEHLKGIEEYVANAAGLTKQLLGFARGGKYEVSPTNLNELIKLENRMFGQTKKEIQIRGKYETKLWTVEVDRGQMRQALLNLYVNAWQAMPGGGDLYIQTENVTFDPDDAQSFEITTDRYVKISISDTGVGMDEATREKIFEPFFTTQEMGTGTGLGLASVYGIIANHGGFINVDSQKGGGTTFNIFLPASDKDVIEEEIPPGEIVTGEGTVLLVDDEEIIIDVSEQLLKRLGYRVLTAGSGKAAIDIYKGKEAEIDMVILDMIMPSMGGRETYDRLKAINPDIKVLLSSGYSINGQAREILDRGCNGFIQKPFNMKELSQKIRET